jgi:uncharacterized repeat protein (TIGR01451 family)
VDDPNTTVDNDPAWARLPQGSPIGIINLSNTNPVQAGDEVEYSVYFLSNGASPALSTSLCDPIPAGTSFISLTNQLQLGTGSFVSAGNFFTPLAPLPPNNSCPDPRNPNGAVIFDLGNLSNVPNDNIGVVRFRVRVN